MPIIVSRTGESGLDTSMFQLQFSVKYTFDYLDVTHLKILIILKTWHKDSEITLIIGNFATIFKCIYAKENLKTNIMKSFKSTAWLLPQPVLIIGTYDKEGKLGKAIGNAFADGKQLK